ncbi:MAG: hypothetical protein Q7T79_04060 [bacterium]|nr:hypothetical protein [bacterium]
MKKYSTICALFFVFLFFVVVNINIANAVDILPTAGKESGDYSLDDMVQVAVNVSKWLLGIVGSLALVMFVYGGVIFLISAGNSEQVKKGQQIIFGAIIGLVLVFTSHAIIQLAFTALDIKGGKAGEWSTSGWFKE